MDLFEITITLLIVGAMLAALARRLGAPYPAFLALAGAALALVPGTPTLALSPELVLTLFVAPTLLDAAYDASPRDLRENWRPIVGSSVVAVVLTVAAVAVAARWLQPDMPWAVAIVLGAIVAPPDASAATAVLRFLRPPHRVLVILEGESLFNDATALLIYRVGLAVAVGAWMGWADVPWLVVSLVGGVALGLALGKIFPWLVSPIKDGPTAVIVQFVGTFALWILATRLGLSPILTLLFFAMTVARRTPKRMNAHLRLQTNAVWDVAIFVLNVLAFILAGLQLRPILANLGGADWRGHAAFGVAILIVCIGVRMAWVMSITATLRGLDHSLRPRQRRPLYVPSLGGSVIVSWCGMRGVVTLATALALPEDPGVFPFRDLVLFAAFAVVLGTLVVQGLTLSPLMSILRLVGDDVIAHEAARARTRAAEAALAALEGKMDSGAMALRAEYERRRSSDPSPAAQLEAEHEHRRLALRIERQTIIALRQSGEIGDDAFHIVEEELDWVEMYVDQRARGVQQGQ
jgi:monovalent cation/hydrogen antiporter